jgi:hypothetical protein
MGTGRCRRQISAERFSSCVTVHIRPVMRDKKEASDRGPFHNHGACVVAWRGRRAVEKQAFRSPLLICSWNKEKSSPYKVVQVLLQTSNVKLNFYPTSCHT